jgi:hypothetical protein
MNSNIKNLPVVNTHFAITYLDAIQRRATEQPRWQDVADAYDAGLRHGVSVDNRQRHRLLGLMNAMRIVNGYQVEDTP